MNWRSHGYEPCELTGLLYPANVVDQEGIEPSTLALSTQRSTKLSYRPKDLFRQHSQRTTRVRCTNHPVRGAGTSGRVPCMGCPMPSRNCATALFANTVEIGRGRTRITHQADPTDPRSYFAGTGTAALAHQRVGPDTRHDTNLLKITCRYVDAPLAWPCEGPESKKPGPLARNRVACVQKGVSYTLPPPGWNEFSKSLPMEVVLAIALVE